MGLFLLVLNRLSNQVLWWGALLWYNILGLLLFLHIFLHLFDIFVLLFARNLFFFSLLLLDGLVLLVIQVCSFSLHSHFLFFELICLLSELFGNLWCFMRLRMLLFRLRKVLGGRTCWSSCMCSGMPSSWMTRCRMTSCCMTSRSMPCCWMPSCSSNSFCTGTQQRLFRMVQVNRLWFDLFLLIMSHKWLGQGMLSLFCRLDWLALLTCNSTMKIIVIVQLLFWSQNRRSTFWLFWVSQIWLWLLILHWLRSTLNVMLLLRCIFSLLLLNRMTFLLWRLFLLLSFFLSMNRRYSRLHLFMLWFLWSWKFRFNHLNFFQSGGLVHQGLIVLSWRLERLHRVLEGVGAQLRGCPGLRIFRIRCHL